MENCRLLALVRTSGAAVVLGTAFLAPLLVSAYTTPTHAALSEEAAALFNTHYPSRALSAEGIDALVRGSIEEDYGLRPLRHFYDPIYDRGLSLFGLEWLTSKRWARENPDHSFDDAVSLYQKGDTEGGLTALGHTLHLIQDAAVPAHTRNDGHPPLFHFGSPYEAWTEQFTPETFDSASYAGTPARRESLEEYFDAMALYSNENFYSKDTIAHPEYALPFVMYYRGAYGYYAEDPSADAYRLVRTKIDLDGDIDFTLIDRKKTILSAYWDRLSKKAVVESSGAIALFFDEVARREGVTGVEAAALGAVLGVRSKAEDDRGRFENATPRPISEPALPAAARAEEDRSASPRQLSLLQPQEESRVEEKTASEIPETPSETGALRSLADVTPTPTGSPYAGFGGGSGSASANPSTGGGSRDGSVNTSNEENTEEATGAELDDVAEAGVETESTAEAVAETEDESTETESGEETGTGASTEAEPGPEPETDTVVETGVVDDPGTEAEADPTANTETEATDTKGENEDTQTEQGGDASSVDSEEDGDGGESDETEEEIQEEAGEVEDKEEAASDETPIPDPPAAGEVVINEIAWMGSAASSADEWIELYNTTDRSISLDGVLLVAEDGVPAIVLSGAIPSRGYYLIERSDDETVSDIGADLIAPFSGQGNGSGLSNDGEDLSLVVVGVQGTTTIDSAGGCESWCAGSSHARRTMERIDPLAPGTAKENWGTAMGEFILNGKDANGNPIFGTPKGKNSASFRIHGGSKVTEDTTLTKEGSPYVVGREGLTVEEGVTLTLEPGTIVKVVSPQEPPIEIKGVIRSKGTSEEPVVITAFADDEYGGDSNGDGVCDPDPDSHEVTIGTSNASLTARCPAPGSWKHLRIHESSTSSSFENTIIRYGGRFGSGTLVVLGADIIFEDSSVEYSRSHGLVLSNSESTVTRGRFVGNATVGRAGVLITGGVSSVTESVFIENYDGLTTSGSESTIVGNSFTGNTHAALTVSGTAPRFSLNNGEGNGLNAIVLGGTITGSAGSRTELGHNPLSYVLKGDVRVAASTTLSFGRGVVVKGHGSTGGPANIGRLTVEGGGTLSFEGGSSDDLIFTSINDDSVGGVTNPAETTPGDDDWRGIRVLAGGRVEIEGASFRFADIALAAEDATVLLTNVLFDGNRDILNTVGNVLIDFTACRRFIDGVLSLIDSLDGL